METILKYILLIMGKTIIFAICILIAVSLFILLGNFGGIVKDTSVLETIKSNINSDSLLIEVNKKLDIMLPDFLTSEEMIEYYNSIEPDQRAPENNKNKEKKGK